MTQDLTRDLRALQELPLLPHTFDRLIRLLDDPRTSEHKLADAIGRDPALTLKLLRLANSPYYGNTGQVAGLDQAVSLIGLNSVRGLLLSLHILQSQLESVGPLLERLAHHGYAAALAVREIARLQRRSQVSTVVSAALLHDLGYLCRLQAYPGVTSFDEWEKRLAEEETASGSTHCQWGYGCARAWNLPEVICQSILDHHDPRPESPHYWIVATVNAGDSLCCEHNLSPVGANGLPPLRQDVADYLDLSPERGEQIIKEANTALQHAGWPPVTTSLLEHQQA